MIRSLTFQLLRAWHAVLRGPRAALLLCLAPLYWLGRLFVRMLEWWSRRESKYLLRGLPSLSVFATAAYLLVACRLHSDAALADTYLMAAKREKDPEAAALLYERVISLRPNDEETLYELAMRSLAAGDYNRAEVVLQKLAPIDGQGYAPAQVLMGRQYLRKSRRYPKNHQLFRDFSELAGKHLENALSLVPKDPQAHALLGQLYYDLEVWNLAIAHFEAAFDPANPLRGDMSGDAQAFKLLLAKAYSFDNKLPEAEKLGNEVRAYFAARVEADPRDDIQSRIVLADACMFLEEFESAAQVLNRGLALNPDNDFLRGALARFNVSWSDAMRLSSTGTRVDRFNLLSDALLADPNYAPIFDRMMGILAEDDAAAVSARKFLHDNVTTEGRSIWLCHLLLGSAAFQSDDADTAAYHLQRAFDLMPNPPIVANNLAWFMTVRDPPDLDEALSLIDHVLVSAPNDPRFLDTRGQIYTKLGRWDEAIADLERVLEQQLSGRETHVALATCYDAKGLSELAKRHRQLADPGLRE